MADVELQEQSVPLKTAEQGTEGAETTAAGAEGAKTEQKATVVTKEKKSWFKKVGARGEIPAKNFGNFLVWAPFKK